MGCINVFLAYAVFFAGPYLPYIDYANHVGLISILARGGETGADAFLARSWAPTPYWLYYVLTALLGRITEVDVASKLVLGASGATWVLGGAHLAEATGRDPRIALAASLGMFGIGLGYGFASFVFTCPLCLFVLGSTERLLGAEARLRRARVLELGAALTLVFLGHPLVFLGTTLAVANADNNTVALVDIKTVNDSEVEGFIPTGWYPTGVLFSPDGRRLFVLNGKGFTGQANPRGPQATSGAADGLKLALNVGAMLIAFVALIALIDFPISKLGHLAGYDTWSLRALLGWMFQPLAWVMGVPWNEAPQVGTLIGIKTAVNEFVGYVEMQKMVSAGQLSERAQIIATYALCGFSNFSSIAIQIGGIGSLAPSKRAWLSEFGMRALLGGTLASLLSATIVGMLV